MARGDVTVFNEAKAFMLNGGFGSADVIKCGICDNTVAPTAASVAPDFTDFTEVTNAGTYVAGGTSLGALSAVVTQAAGVMKFTSATNPTWAQNASNAVNAYWGIIYNSTDAGKRAIAFVDLGGPVDMTAGSLTITWNAAGIFTIT